MNYELVEAQDCFDDENSGLTYGINWLDDDGTVVDCEWFATVSDREQAIDLWYANTQDTTPEQ